MQMLVVLHVLLANMTTTGTFTVSVWTVQQATPRKLRVLPAPRNNVLLGELSLARRRCAAAARVISAIISAIKGMLQWACISAGGMVPSREGVASLLIAQRVSPSRIRSRHARGPLTRNVITLAIVVISLEARTYASPMGTLLVARVSRARLGNRAQGMALAASVQTAQLRPHRSVIVLPVHLEKLEVVDSALSVRQAVAQTRAELTALVAQRVVLASTGSGAHSVHRGISPQMASPAASRNPDIGQTRSVRDKSFVLAILVVLRESAFRVGPEKRVILTARNVPLASDVGTSLVAKDASPATQVLYPTTRSVQHSASAAPFKEPQQSQAHGMQMLTGLRAARLQLSVTRALSPRRV